MQDGQLDLFAAAGFRQEGPNPFPQPHRQQVVAAALNDAALIAAISGASLATCRSLAQEAAQRKLVAAVPALEALCRRFKGFGLRHAIPEQIASLQALATIGGAAAIAAIRRIIVGDVVAGPGLSEAMRAAAELRCILPEPTALGLLCHPYPEIRVLACRCAPPTAQIALLLGSLLEDLNPGVATAAALALGRMGRTEARPWLIRRLRENPDAELVEAVTPVADEECTVVLGRVARQHAALRDAAMAALEAIDTPRAGAILAGLARPDSPLAGGNPLPQEPAGQ
jgi:hypothetical protein